MASVLYFTIPLFIPFVAYVWKRQKIPHLNWFGIGLGFIGVVLVINPGRAIFHTASLIGLASGFFASIGQFSVHLLSSTESSYKLNFYYFVISIIIAFPLTFIQFDQSWNLTTYDFLIFFGIGAFTYIYLMFIAEALKYGSPSLVTTFLYSAVIFAVFLDWIIWGTVIDLITLIGVICVIGGVILRVYLHKRNSH